MSVEAKRKIVTDLVRRICACGGEMTITGKSRFLPEIGVEHSCTRCKAVEWLGRTYPYVDDESDEIYPLDGGKG